MQVILSSRQALVSKYGAYGFARLDGRLKELQAALGKDGLEASIVYVDDARSLKPFGLRPLRKPQTKTIKALMDRLEEILSLGPDRTHWLLIGGDDTIPLFRLKNPAEDNDDVVYSDNPYASSTGSVLVPERSLGRLPGDHSPDVNVLLTQIDHAVYQHLNHPPTSGFFGESAAVWRKAAEAAVAPVAAAGALKISPPETRATFQPAWLDATRFDYFNLHGVDETPYWYGQEGDHFPIALGPREIAKANVRGSVVFSEACYGALIVGKRSADSICLTCLQQGVAGFVGSTVICYGTTEPPAADADLLGKLFLARARAGSPLGDALRLAKEDFARAVFEEEGYLDGDDKKTLLGFVLYGDPSLRVR
jgi:hypothetical protein